MNRKIALKRLSSSDLTLFEHHYRNSSGAKQKAINLDAAVFVGTLFPSLPDRLDVLRDRVIITLTIYGPGGVGAHTITRKILKQQKNWRLNGELIFNPPEEPSRYDLLAKGDYAIFDFAGDPEPHTARMCLAARNIPQDTLLHTALENRYRASFSSHKGMMEISPDDLAEVLNNIDLPESHPVLDFIDFDVLEDASQGGLDGLAKLRKRRQTRGVSREELNRARQGADRIGRLGEEVLNSWLALQFQAGCGSEYQWESDINAVAPYDFTLMPEGKAKRRVDAKSTAGDFRNPVHVSMAELLEMAQGGHPYDLYRLYMVTAFSAHLRIARNLGQFAQDILAQFANLPHGITVDGTSISPDTLSFEDEIMIDLSENTDDTNESESFDNN
ncbi:hypothetical protein VSS37_07480 [Candidatus Thiothrix sp. Deng01]|uniref:Protein NO VEIN C-terminal domain-containing protein n=1 Tax=Candidatus Thiothrix phosphatis TaxID=3112415 RepID=A0ABU6CVF9_9GAMM|nr:hypothetical protein [Candidatus Thiothrix sp. Deng01]MEB4590814.1 hypothetical protein [Candidatus Thiothrix sp. Deng01]